MIHAAKPKRARSETADGGARPRAIRTSGRGQACHDDADTSVVFSRTAAPGPAALPSGVSGLGVRVPVLGEPALRLIGLSPLPAGDTGLLPCPFTKPNDAGAT